MPAKGNSFSSGDLIDRGPEQKETVEIVRELCERGYAVCLTGNHEFNAVGFVTERIDEPGKYVRSHTDNHIRQHQDFLDAYANDLHGYREILDWFSTLPLWFDNGDVRAVHACWNQEAQFDLASLLTETQSPIGKSFYEQTGITGSRPWEARETLLNGLEARLPDNVSFEDYYGIRRRRIRVNWWASEQTTFRDAAVIDDGPTPYHPGYCFARWVAKLRGSTVFLRALLDARNAADSTPMPSVSITVSRWTTGLCAPTSFAVNAPPSGTTWSGSIACDDLVTATGKDATVSIPNRI